MLLVCGGLVRHCVVGWLDDPALLDHYPDYTTETDVGDRPPTPTQQRDENTKPIRL
jgi:hypothetical protein